MNRSAVCHRIGVAAGVAAYASCLCGKELMQYCAALLCILSFALSERLAEKALAGKQGPAEYR